MATTATYTWNTGATSTVFFATTTVTRLADGTSNVTSVGSVTAGFALGSTAVREKIFPELDVTACMSTQGVTQLSGPATLTFTL